MTPAQVRRARWVAQEIARDCEADAKRFEGQPFTGRTVAEYFGVMGAQVAALAELLDMLLVEVLPGAQPEEHPPGWRPGMAPGR